MQEQKTEPPDPEQFPPDTMHFEYGPPSVVQTIGFVLMVLLTIAMLLFPLLGLCLERVTEPNALNNCH